MEKALPYARGRRTRRCPHCDVGSAQYYRSRTHDWRCLRCGAIDPESSLRPKTQIAVMCTICEDFLIVTDTRDLECPVHGVEGVPERLRRTS